AALDILPRGLFRRFRGDRVRHTRKPAVDERLQPRTLGDIVHRPIGKMLMTRASTRRIHAVITARGPAMHHRVGDVGMKLKAEGMAELKSLVREVVAGRKKFGACG